MNNFKATPEQWKKVESWASVLSPMSADSACILELRSRIERLEAQSNHIPDATKMVSVATDAGRLMDDIWHKTGDGVTFVSRRRAIYDLGIEHGQARSRDMLEQEAGR